MAVLVQVPVEDTEGGAVVLVESDREDIRRPDVGFPRAWSGGGGGGPVVVGVAGATRAGLADGEGQVVASAPEHFTVEFGVKLGGETGIILAKGTAEVNLKITMTWDREIPASRGREWPRMRRRLSGSVAGRRRAHGGSGFAGRRGPGGDLRARGEFRVGPRTA